MNQASAFEISVPDEDLADLRRRLRSTRWADDFGNDDGRYGIKFEWLKMMVDYWAEDFSWRDQEVRMNALPQFRVVLDDVPIHFIHLRSRRSDAIPIICTHGWPWTFWDWHAVIEPLVNPPAGEPAFHVVVPSLPGYGFSVPLRKTGVHVRRIAALWNQLMQETLGYREYAAAGGSWGGTIAGELGHAYPGHILGCWLSGPNVPGIGTSLAEQHRLDSLYSAEPGGTNRHAELRGFLSSHVGVHQVEPQTLAYALVDSPVGTAAWLWARRRELTDSGGDPLNVWDQDFLCTTASIYWLTKSIGTSLRLYSDSLREPNVPMHNRERVIDVPTGIGVFPHDVLHLPREFIERKVNLVHWAGVQPAGGHFAPSEVPTLVVDDIRALFKNIDAG